MNNGLRATIITLSLTAIMALIGWGLGSARLPLLIAFGLAYLIFPLVKRLEARGIKRQYAVLGVFLSSTIFSLIVAAVVIPGLVADANTFFQELPGNTARALEKIENLAAGLGLQLELNQEGIRQFILEHASEISSGMLKNFSSGFLLAFSGLTKWLVTILNLFLIPLFFFHVINDFEIISREIRTFIPPSARPKLGRYIELSNGVLSGYIHGQVMVALILACLYSLGLTITGLKFGFLIGFGSGLLSIIPYAGFALGFAAAILMAFATHASPGLFVGVIAVYLLVQALESFLITPKLVGDKVGLSALATMLALIVGGNLLGFVGMLIAIPSAAILKTILSDLKKEFQQLELYKN